MKPGALLVIDDCHLNHPENKPWAVDVKAAVLKACEDKRLKIIHHFDADNREHVVCEKIFTSSPDVALVSL
jgi:hypothetical protein